MEKILELDICVLFDAHKGPVESPQEHIKIRIEYLKNTEKEIRTLHQEGKTVLEIVESLEFRRPWYLDLTKDRFGVDFFVESILEDHTKQLSLGMDKKLEKANLTQAVSFSWNGEGIVLNYTFNTIGG